MLTTLASAWLPALVSIDGDRPHRAERYWRFGAGTAPRADARWEIGIALADGTRILGKDADRPGMRLRQSLREPRWADTLEEAAGRPIERPIPARLLPTATSPEALRWIDEVPDIPGRAALHWSFGWPLRVMDCSCEVASARSTPVVWEGALRIGMLNPDGMLPVRVRWAPFVLMTVVWAALWFGVLRMLVPVWRRAATLR